MTTPITNPNNLIITLVILIFIILGCKNSSDTNSNANNPKIIGGDVFPANEVCNYPKGSIAEKLGKFKQNWYKVPDPDWNDPNTLYGCGGGYEYIKSKDYANDFEVSLGYTSLGSRPEGAYRIGTEYRVMWERDFPAKAESAFRTNTLIPFYNEISKKALKQPLSTTMTKKITSIKRGDFREDGKSNRLCEKLGQGFVCVSDSTNPTAQGIWYIDFKIFASEESYQNYLNE